MWGTDAPRPKPDAPRPKPDTGGGGGCDPLQQNCPNSGDACYWRASGSGGPYCAKHGSTMGPSCTADTDCAKAHGCQAMGPMNACMRYCDTRQSNSCMTSERCRQLEGNVGVCEPAATCDPVANSGCQRANDVCYYDESAKGLSCRPAAPIAKGQGASCNQPQECLAKYHCHKSCNKCGKYCSVGKGNADCNGVAGASTCVKVDGDVGVCSARP